MRFALCAAALRRALTVRAAAHTSKLHPLRFQHMYITLRVGAVRIAWPSAVVRRGRTVREVTVRIVVHRPPPPSLSDCAIGHFSSVAPTAKQRTLNNTIQNERLTSSAPRLSISSSAAILLTPTCLPTSRSTAPEPRPQALQSPLLRAEVLVVVHRRGASVSGQKARGNPANANRRLERVG